jgi:hypothetical protein
MGLFVRSAVLVHIRALVAPFYIKIRLMHLCTLPPIYSHCFLNSYIFQPSRGHLEGVLIYLMNQVNKIVVSIENASFCLTENTLHFHEKDQSLNGA